MQLSRYLKVFPAPHRQDSFLLYSTLRSSTVLVSAATLRAAMGGEEQGAKTQTLRRLGMLVEDPAAEREQMRSLLESVNGKSRRFTAIVVLNLDCNLECA